MQEYLSLLSDVLNNGSKKNDRTGIGMLSVFGRQLRFNLLDTFPLVTTKKIHFKSVVYELLWLLRGDTNIKYLNDNGVSIWNEWADENGDLGPVYGKQWRSWEKYEFINGRVFTSKIDQIKNAIDKIKNNPNDRRIMVSSLNVGDIDYMKSYPCHIMFQFYVDGDKLSCQLYQRSADLFLGTPFNIASYALLTMMIAQVCGLKAYEFIYSLGVAHIYLNHIEQVKLQLLRKPFELPTIFLNKNINNIDDFKYEDIMLNNYKHYPRIKAKVAI